MEERDHEYVLASSALGDVTLSTGSATGFLVDPVIQTLVVPLYLSVTGPEEVSSLDAYVRALRQDDPFHDNVRVTKETLGAGGGFFTDLIKTDAQRNVPLTGHSAPEVGSINMDPYVAFAQGQVKVADIEFTVNTLPGQALSEYPVIITAVGPWAEPFDDGLGGVRWYGDLPAIQFSLVPELVSVLLLAASAMAPGACRRG